MTRKPRRALHFGGLAALALATASCGGDEPATIEESSGFSLFDPIGSDQWPGGIADSPLEFSEADYFAGALPPYPEAAPMVSRVSQGYGFAPDYYADYPVSEPVYYDPEPSDDSYAWLALAAALGGVLGDAPPDYYFDYGGVEPWAWETGDHFVRYAEPIGYGYRYYYYSPGRAYPFLVRDPYYSYGYHDDRVVVIYDDDGRVLDGRRSWRQRHAARRYYARAHALREASRVRPHHGIAAPLWNDRRTIIAREQRQWDRARAQRAGWRNWDRRHHRVTAPRWTRERAARQYAARRFDGWRKADYRGPAPRFYAESKHSPRLRQAVQHQRERRRDDRRALVGREQTRGSLQWRAPDRERRAERVERATSRGSARSERARARQERIVERRANSAARRGERRETTRIRRVQAAREQARNERRARPAHEHRRAARNINRAAAPKARREARSHHEAQASRAQRRQARAHVRSQARREARAQQRARTHTQASRHTRTQHARAQSQARRPTRVQQHASRPRYEVRAQHTQARSQARQQARAQRQQRRHAAHRGASRPSRMAERRHGGGNHHRMH